jgi:broad specificity phosphatase PhoE
MNSAFERPAAPLSSRTLLLVRHGLPDYRYRGRADEPPGPPLTEVGKRQALEAAEYLTRYPVQAVYSSPLARALETARCIATRLNVRLQPESRLSEWHRSESLFEVSQRSACWLRRWLSSQEACAVVVGHASPLLAVLRTALYLPHAPWHCPGRPQQLWLDSADRFELCMAAVVELKIQVAQITAELVFKPAVAIIDAQYRPIRRYLPVPVVAGRKSLRLCRPNFLHLVGCARGRG